MQKKLVTILLLLISCTTQYVFAQADPLDNYINELKTDHAGPRNKTGFLSVGYDFLNAQEYFEAKNYSSAASSYLRIAEKDSSNPFLNYQWAVALLLQRDPYKQQQAQPFLQRALQQVPALEKRLAADVPGYTNKPAAPATNNPVGTPQALPSSPGGLQQYIERLKYSSATRGAETAMNTPGQAAMYAIEYYEAKDYKGAENGFKLALLHDATNTYVKYMLAVSLAAQGKNEEAKIYLDQAIKNDAGLKELYPQDVALASAAWNKQEDAKKIKTTPAPPVVYGGALVYGNYMCSQTVYRGANATPAYGYVEKGYYNLKPDGTYRWLENGPTGRDSYNSTTGTITWLSGYLKNNGIKSTKYQRNNKSGQMTLTYSENYTWQCGCNKK